MNHEYNVHWRQPTEEEVSIEYRERWFINPIAYPYSGISESRHADAKQVILICHSYNGPVSLAVSGVLIGDLVI